MTLFALALQPLLDTLQTHTMISGVKLPGRHNIKYIAYADDLTLILKNDNSVTQAFQTLKNFKDASGLDINPTKTVGHIHESKKLPQALIPRIKWTHEPISPLNIPLILFKKHHTIWPNILIKLQNKVRSLSTHHSTLELKSIFSKALLMPIITYHANIFPIPVNTGSNINNIIETYMASQKGLSLSIDILASSKQLGGYQFPNIPLYAEIFYLKPISRYLNERENMLPLSPLTCLIEFNIGLQLSKTFGLRYLNHMPHSSDPSPYHTQAIQIINKHKITLDELTNFNTKKTI